MPNYEFVCEWTDPSSHETLERTVLGFVRPEDAAIDAIRRHEWDTTDFPIAAGRESVVVTVHAEDGSVSRYEVSGDSAPRYFAVPAANAEQPKETTHA